MLFFTALAAQMLVDFFPIPWKGRVGVLKDDPYARCAIVVGAMLVEGLPFLNWWVVVCALAVGFLYALKTRIVARIGTPRRSPSQAAAGAMCAREAAMHLGLSVAVAAVVVFVLGAGFPAVPPDVAALVRLPHSLWSSFPAGAALAAKLPSVSAWAVGYLFSLGFGSLAVGALLAGLQREVSHERVSSENAGEAENVEEGIRHAGRLIGFFEAFIVTTLVAVNQWSAISFLVAAKAVGRIKQMEERPFAEYFLVGTFANISIAIIGGLIIRAVSAM